MARTAYGLAVETLGNAPMFVGCVAGMAWSVMRGEDWKKGDVRATAAIGGLIEGLVNYVDAHEREIDTAVEHVVSTLVGQYADSQLRKAQGAGKNPFLP